MVLRSLCIVHCIPCTHLRHDCKSGPVDHRYLAREPPSSSPSITHTTIPMHCKPHSLSRVDVDQRESVLVCLGCQNNTAQTFCLKSGVVLSCGLKARCPRSSCWQGWFFLRALSLACRQLPSCCLFLCPHAPASLHVLRLPLLVRIWSDCNRADSNASFYLKSLKFRSPQIVTF